MKRCFLFLLAISLCGVASAVADENVRAAQSRLKEGGFYFGEMNGVFDSDTAAAVSRYQIRNGLQISGQLDAGTAKALGVPPAAAGDGATERRAEPEPWRRLRKTDPQFLKERSSGNIAAPEAATSTPTGLTAPGYNGAQTLVMSRERLRDYIGAFVLAGLDPGVDAELEFFAERVRYYDEGTVDRKKIRRDLLRYNQRWPERRFWLDGEVEVEAQPDSLVRVTFPLRFELRNRSDNSSGKVRKALLLEVAGEDLQIVGVSERKMR